MEAPIGSCVRTETFAAYRNPQFLARTPQCLVGCAVGEDEAVTTLRFAGSKRARAPNATWLALTQVLGDKDSFSFGWRHAGKSEGVLGAHNSAGDPDNFDNSANLYSLAWRHMLDKYTTFYADWAITVSHADAHYDIGAGGHGVTTDCHDSTPLAAFDPTTGAVTNAGPRCFSGGKPQGVSVGVNYKF